MAMKRLQAFFCRPVGGLYAFQESILALESLLRCRPKTHIFIDIHERWPTLSESQPGRNTSAAAECQSQWHCSFLPASSEDICAYLCLCFRTLGDYRPPWSRTLLGQLWPAALDSMIIQETALQNRYSRLRDSIHQIVVSLVFPLRTFLRSVLNALLPLLLQQTSTRELRSLQTPLHYCPARQDHYQRPELWRSPSCGPRWHLPGVSPESR